MESPPGSQKLGTLAKTDGVDFGAFERVVEAAYAEPTIAVGLKQDAVTGAFSRIAVVLREQVDQGPAFFFGDAHREAHFLRFRAQVGDTDDGVVAPVVANDQNL